MRHRARILIARSNGHVLPVGGLPVALERRGASLHARVRPQALQKAVRQNSKPAYQAYAKLVNEQGKALCTLRSLLDFKDGNAPIPIEEVESAESDHEALQDRRHVLRLHLERGARDARHRDEPHRRQVQHRRRRRGSRALHVDQRARRLEELRDQAGRLRPLRRHERIPRQRARAPDQDGAGREARRRRPVARLQGLSVGRQDPRHHRPASASSPRRRITTSTPSRISPS